MAPIFQNPKSPSWWLFSSTRCCDWNQRIKVPGAERPSGMLDPREAVSDKQRASAPGRSSSSRHRLLDWLMSNVNIFAKVSTFSKVLPTNKPPKFPANEIPVFCCFPKCRKKCCRKMGTRLLIDWACHIFDKYLDARKSAESKVLNIHSATSPKTASIPQLSQKRFSRQSWLKSRWMCLKLGFCWTKPSLHWIASICGAKSVCISIYIYIFYEKIIIFKMQYCITSTDSKNRKNNRIQIGLGWTVKPLSCPLGTALAYPPYIDDASQPKRGRTHPVKAHPFHFGYPWGKQNPKTQWTPAKTTGDQKRPSFQARRRTDVRHFGVVYA